DGAGGAGPSGDGSARVPRLHDPHGGRAHAVGRIRRVDRGTATARKGEPGDRPARPSALAAFPARFPGPGTALAGSTARRTLAPIRPETKSRAGDLSACAAGRRGACATVAVVEQGEQAARGYRGSDLRGQYGGLELGKQALHVGTTEEVL